MQNLSDGISLLNAFSEFIRRFVTLSEAQADVCAVWTVHTHALEAAEFTPYLDINSPVHRSGKTRLLEVLRLIVRRQWFTGRVSGPALVRKTAKEQPTLLLDESDTAFSSKDDYSEKLRGILNTGFERGGTYSTCIQNGNNWDAHDFSTFAPKAIAGIGQLPTTIQDRSIPIRLKRALRHEKRERFHKRKVQPEAETLRKHIEEWVASNLDVLRESEPPLPDELNDRQQDVCEPLLAIADHAGGDWPQRTRIALIVLCGSVPEQQDASLSLALLADIRLVFQGSGADRLRTCDLLRELCLIEASPWCEHNRGKPLSSYGLSKILRGFGIYPQDHRFGDHTRKGYLRDDFGEAWARYLPAQAVEGQQGQQVAVYAGSYDLPEGQHAPPVAPAKIEESPVNTLVVADVAPERRDKGNGHHNQTETALIT